MGCVSKYGLITINFFVVVIGLCVVGVSAAILRQNTIFGVILTNVFYTVPLTTLLGGVFLMCLGLLGCLGAIKESPIMLKSYAVVVSVLLIVVTTAGICMFVFAANTSDYIVRGMTTVFDQYGDEDQEYITQDLDYFQHMLHCCGINSYKDWANFTYGNGTNVADGCCRNATDGCGQGLLHNPDVEDLVYTTGCLYFVTSAFDTICLALGIITFILACVQALSIAWACIIARDAAKTYHHLYD